MLKIYPINKVLEDVFSIYGIEIKSEIKKNVNFTMLFQDYIRIQHPENKQFKPTEKDFHDFVLASAIPELDLKTDSLIEYEVVVFGFHSERFENAFFIGGVKENDDAAKIEELKNKLETSHYDSILILTDDVLNGTHREMFYKDEPPVIH